MLYEVVHDFFLDQGFHQFAHQRRKTDRPVVFSNALGAFLIDGGDKCSLPVIRDSSISHIVLFRRMEIGRATKSTSSFSILGWISSGPQDLSTFVFSIASTTIFSRTKILSRMAVVRESMLGPSPGGSSV